MASGDSDQTKISKRQADEEHLDCTDKLHGSSGIRSAQETEGFPASSPQPSRVEESHLQCSSHWGQREESLGNKATVSLSSRKTDKRHASEPSELRARCPSPNVQLSQQNEERSETAVCTHYCG
ncbi:uncharacterized protein LOC144366741 [Ictidomys tridecemlineatus]